MTSPDSGHREPPARGELTVKNVSKTFAGQKALDRVSLTFRPGEVHCLLGQNGSGKSTMVKILSGFHQPDPGSSAAVGNEPLALGDSTSARRLGLRFAHQQLGVIGAMSAVENTSLGFGLGSSRWGFHRWRQQEATTRELLARVGVTDIDVRRPLQQARAIDRTAVAIARAVDPAFGEISYLFLDEPTAALPPVEVTRLFELIREVTSHGTGVIYVTHRLDEVFEVAQRVSVLRDGKHIGTFDVADLDKSRLIELIVGERVRDRVAERLAGPGGSGQPTPPAASPAAEDASPAEATAKPLLSVRHLRTPLLDATFEVSKGEVLGIAGLAGSGRESLVYALIGAQRSSAERIEMAGTLVGTSLSPRSAKLLGIILAPGNRMPGSQVSRFSLRENLTLPVLSRYRKYGVVDKREERSVTRKWIADLRVAGAQGPAGDRRLPTQLSGGNQQKIILAKALNTTPNLVLLDEPTAGVDVGARESLYEVIRQQATDGVSFIISSSDIDDLLAVCDRVLVMGDGQVRAAFDGERLSEATLLDAVMHSEADPAAAGH